MLDTTTSPAEAIPVFAGDFDAFVRYMNAANIPAAISSARFALLLSIDSQTLAKLARFNRNTLRRAPESANVQRFLRQGYRLRFHALAPGTAWYIG